MWRPLLFGSRLILLEYAIHMYRIEMCTIIVIIIESAAIVFALSEHLFSARIRVLCYLCDDSNVCAIQVTSFSGGINFLFRHI